MKHAAPTDACHDGEPTTIGVKLGYGVGNLGKSIVWTSFESFMLFYLVSIAGFSPRAAGAVLTLAMLWDAMVDTLIAGWTDRHGRADALGRLVLFGAPLGGTCFWLAFTLERPAAIAVAIVLCRIGYSMCDIGHNTLLVRVARTPRDATAVSGIRLIFSASGAGLVALASGWSLSIAGRAGQQGSFATGAMIGGMVYVATLFVAIAATRRLPPVRRVATGRTPLDVRALLAHPPFRRTLTLVAVQAGMVALFVRALAFFGQAVHGDPGWAGPALATITLAQSLSLPGWIAASRRCPPVRLATIGYGVLLAVMAGLAIRSDGVAGTLLLALAGVSLSGINMAIWALLALAVRSSIAGGSAAEALPVGLFLGAIKGASAISTAVVALLVAFGGGTLGGIAILPACAVGIPLTGCAVALLLLRRWP